MEGTGIMVPLNYGSAFEREENCSYTLNVYAFLQNADQRSYNGRCCIGSLSNDLKNRS